MKKKTSEQRKQKNSYQIFAAIPHNVGHDRRGLPLYRMTKDGEIEIDEAGLPILDDDIPSIAPSFRQWAREVGMI